MPTLLTCTLNLYVVIGANLGCADSANHALSFFSSFVENSCLHRRNTPRSYVLPHGWVKLAGFQSNLSCENFAKLSERKTRVYGPSLCCLPLNCLRHYLKHTLTPPNADVVWLMARSPRLVHRRQTARAFICPVVQQDLEEVA